jgi:hypothetical protein
VFGVLAGLLPGLRAVRAPLAAGYLWLVAAWVALEPAIPQRAEATGVAASLYRAGDLVSVLGLGVVLSFAAYLLGSLSASAGTPALRALYPSAQGDRDPFAGLRRLVAAVVRYRPATIPRAPLSTQARAALGQIARGSRDRLVTSLALSGTDVDRFLRDELETPDGDGMPPASTLRRPPRDKIYRADGPVGPGSALPQDINAGRAALLARAVIRDLDVVARTRLLGRDQELYAEVDRHRAEAEFRLAIIPPLLGLAVALAARSGGPLGWLVLPLGALLAWGLFVDAARAERAANEILLDAIADRRVQSPTLERLEMQAATLAGESRPELMSTVAKDAAVALQGAARSLESAATSEPSWARYARLQVDVARESVERVSRIFPPATAVAATDTLRLLSELADAWMGVIEGRGASGIDTRAHLDQARQRLGEFREQALEAIERQRQLAVPAAADPPP